MWEPDAPDLHRERHRGVPRTGIPCGPVGRRRSGSAIHPMAWLMSLVQNEQLRNPSGTFTSTALPCTPLHHNRAVRRTNHRGGRVEVRCEDRLHDHFGRGDPRGELTVRDDQRCLPWPTLRNREAVLVACAPGRFASCTRRPRCRTARLIATPLYAGCSRRPDGVRLDRACCLGSFAPVAPSPERLPPPSVPVA